MRRRFLVLLFRATNPVLGPLYRRLFRRRIVSWLRAHGLEEEDLMGSLKGKKTYVTAFLAILSAIGSLLVGDADLAATLDGLWQVLTPLALVFLRSGVKDEVKALPAPTS